MFSKLSLRNEAGLRLTSRALRALPLNRFERTEWIWLEDMKQKSHFMLE